MARKKEGGFALEKLESLIAVSIIDEYKKIQGEIEDCKKKMAVNGRSKAEISFSSLLVKIAQIKNEDTSELLKKINSSNFRANQEEESEKQEPSES
ncbi:hypothetical protein KJ853_04010 [Patescibacteria group bacterium]|nr:hypothetical protein [Patescibacteria group bacterium]